MTSNKNGAFIFSGKTSTTNNNRAMTTLRVRNSTQVDAGFTDSGNSLALNVAGFLKGGGTISNFVNVNSAPQLLEDVIVTTYKGIQSSYTLNLGGNVINSYLFYAARPFHSATSGDTTNLYGLYMENIDKGTSLNYAIYTNTGKVRFGDDVETTGTLKVGGLVEYADNAAATTAGLTAGDFYRTADGTVKVVF